MNIASSFHFAANVVKDCVFPIFCLGCDQEGIWLCDACRGKIDTRGVFVCPLCHHFTGTGASCSACLGKSALDGHIAITGYQEHSLIGRLIAALKYQYAEDVSSVFDSIVSKFAREQAGLMSSVDVVAPVPLHRRRFAERGFNQAEIIGRIVAGALGKPFVPLLKRHRATKQQALLSRDERKQNVRDAFRLAGERNWKLETRNSGRTEERSFVGMRVLLVDDVFTTGSTMQECAKILKHAGVAGVFGFSVARG